MYVSCIRFLGACLACFCYNLEGKLAIYVVKLTQYTDNGQFKANTVGG